MKNYFKILCLFILVTACKKDDENFYVEYKDITEINSIEITELTKMDEGKFFNPKFTASGTKAVFTTESYSGIWYYDFKTKIVNQLNPSIGAGIGFDVSRTADNVYFRLQSTSAKGSVRNYSIAEQDINSKFIDILYTSQNYLSEPKALDDGNVAFVYDNEIKVIDREKKVFIENYDSKNIIAFSDGSSVLFKNGDTNEEFTPIGEGSILWVEVSPQNDKIYFNSSEKGTGYYSIDTKEITWLGDYKYLRCSAKSNLFAYSKYENYNSDLFISAEGSSANFNLSNSDDENEMFPCWSNDGKAIIFNTAEGIIKLINFKIFSGSNV